MLTFARSDLRSIRADAASLFAAWDAALTDQRLEIAKQIRRNQLWPLVRSRLQMQDLDRPGIYAFIENVEEAGWNGVSYIGQSEGILRNRLEHYVKDDSCWDPRLLADPEAVEETAFARLRPLMSSTPEVMRKHIAKHRSAVGKTRGCSLFVAGFSQEIAHLIVPTEAALIALAWSGGAELENGRLERLPRGQERSMVLSICQNIIVGWAAHGLNPNLFRAAHEAVRRAAVDAPLEPFKTDVEPVTGLSVDAGR